MAPGQAARLMDDEDTDLPGGNGTEGALKPQVTAPIQTQREAAQEADDDFEILEVDDNDAPLSGQAQQTEGRLSEAEGGERPLVNNQASDDQNQNLSRNQRRREIRRQGKTRTLDENNALRQQVQSLSALVNQVVPQLAELSEGRIKDEIGRYDSSIRQAQSLFEQAEKAVATAITNGDSEALLAAMRTRDEQFIAKNRAEQSRTQFTAALEARKAGGQQGGADRGQAQPQAQTRQAAAQPQGRVLSQQAKGFATDFQSDTPWLNPESDDPKVRADSKRLMRIDAAVEEDGFDPDTEEYWDELDRRAREELPHRYTNGAAAPQAAPRAAAPARRGPMTTGGAEGRPAVAKNQVRITPGRKQAMVDAGVIDGATGKVLIPAKFKGLLKQFAEYDRANGAAR